MSSLKNDKIFVKLFLPSLLICLLIKSNVYANTTVTVSDEAVGNNIAGRAAAATLDDNWANSLPSGTFNPDLFQGGSGYDGAKTITDSTGAFYNVAWEVGYIDGVGPGTPTSTNFIKATSGTVTYGPSNNIQGKSPNPVAESRLSTSFSAPGLNAIRLDFSASLTPIYEFGIFIGDAESRLNNGTAARMIVFDKFGVLLKDQAIIYTGTVLNGSDYTSIEPLGSPSGPANTPSGYWGNNTTAFVTVKSDQIIGKVIFQAGDDDHTVSNNGTKEQIGLTGILLPYEPFVPVASAPPSPDPPVFEPNHQSVILLGNVLFYAHKFRSSVNGSVSFSSISSGNTSSGWAQRIYLDHNCDGILNGAEGSADFYGVRLSSTTWKAASLNFVADEEICLINKVFAPVNTAANDRYIQQIRAEFVGNDGKLKTLQVQDKTSVSSGVDASALELRKTVQNVTRAGLEIGTVNQVLPGDTLKYRVYYRNMGTGPLSDMVINDVVPEYTNYLVGTATCPSLPAGMVCNAGLSAGGIRWQFSGELLGGANGFVSYEVQLEN